MLFYCIVWLRLSSINDTMTSDTTQHR